MKNSFLKATNIRIVLVFLLTFSLLFCLFSKAYGSFRRYGWNYELVIGKERNLDAEKQNSIDTVFLGDSLTRAAFSPGIIEEYTGLSSYNCGLSGQWLGDGLAILQHVYTRQAPKYVIVESNCLYRDLDQFTLWCMDHLPFIAYHLMPLYLLDNQAVRDDSRGFSSNDTVVPYDGPLDYMQSNIQKEEIKNQIRIILDDLLLLCRQHDTELIIVTVPSARSMIDGQWVSWTTGRHLAVQEWCDQNGIEYVDYNMLLDEIGFDWKTDTRDGGDHVNNSGAKKICTDFASRVLDDRTAGNRKESD